MRNAAKNAGKSLCISRIAGQSIAALPAASILPRSVLIV
jgi:hypothetical protein